MASSYKSDMMLSINFDPDKARSSVEVCEKMRETNKAVVVKKFANKEIASIPSSGFKSTVSESFRGHHSVISDKERSPDEFKDHFDLFASGPENEVFFGDVSKVVQSCLGPDTPTYIIDKFVKLATLVARNRYLSWQQFRWKFAT